MTFVDYLSDKRLRLVKIELVLLRIMIMNDPNFTSFAHVGMKMVIDLNTCTSFDNFLLVFQTSVNQKEKQSLTGFAQLYLSFDWAIGWKANKEVLKICQNLYCVATVTCYVSKENERKQISFCCICFSSVNKAQ